MHPLILVMALAAEPSSAEAMPNLEADVNRRFMAVCSETGGDWAKVEAAAVALGFKEEQVGKAPAKPFQVRWKLEEAGASWSVAVTRMESNAFGPIANGRTDICALGRTDKATGASITFNRVIGAKP